jgi:hypothetical protein
MLLSRLAIVSALLKVMGDGDAVLLSVGMAIADAALYVAKEQGRCQLVVAS